MISLPATKMTSEGLTVAAASPVLLRTLLDEFEEELQHQGVETHGWLAPGETPDVTRAILESNGLIPNEEVVTWFAWHNGELDAPGSLPRFALRDLNQVIRQFNGPKSQPLGYETWQWNPNWLRISWDGGEGIAVRLDDDPSDAPLVRYVTDEGEFGTQPAQTERQVVSLCTPVTWWIEALRNGWYQTASDQRPKWNINRAAQPDERTRVGLS